MATAAGVQVFSAIPHWRYCLWVCEMHSSGCQQKSSDQLKALKFLFFNFCSTMITFCGFNPSFLAQAGSHLIGFQCFFDLVLNYCCDTAPWPLWYAMILTGAVGALRRPFLWASPRSTDCNTNNCKGKIVRIFSLWWETLGSLCYSCPRNKLVRVALALLHQHWR